MAMTIDMLNARVEVLEKQLAILINNNKTTSSTCTSSITSTTSITCTTTSTSKKVTNITKRISTQQSAGIRDYIQKNKDIKQPIFTKEDEKKKIEIWKYKTGQSAFSDAKEEAKDHIYGKREGIKKYDVSGSDTPWNTLPCTHSENSGSECWKKIKNCNKNLVYDFYNFTPEEIENFDENTKNKYDNLKDWINYCHERGAVLCYYGVKEIDLKIRKKAEEQANEFNQYINNLE